LGCALAAAHCGRVTVLHVTASGQQPAWLVVPAMCDDVTVSVAVRTGRDPSAEILTAVRKDPPDLLVLGWRGRPRSGRYLVGRNLDTLVQYAPCDTAIACPGRVRIAADTASPPGALLGSVAGAAIERVLVPMGGGPNAPLALDLALALSPQVEVTALTVAPASQGEVGLSLGRERLDDILEPWAGAPRLHRKVVQAASPTKGILTEAAQRYDLVMMGASRESYVDRVLFGNIPQAVATRSPAPTIVIKRHSRRVGFWLWRTVWRLYDVLPNLDLREQIEVYKAVREGAQPKVDFYVMIALSSAIATFGLMLNSPAVIIGAMLVAPLMAATFGLSVVRGDLRLLRRATSATLRGALLAISVALLLALLAVVLTGPETALQTEVLSRTRPNLADLGVALAAGAAGADALCRKDVSASLPGVAIAAALVPPLGGNWYRHCSVAGGDCRRRAAPVCHQPRGHQRLRRTGIPVARIPASTRPPSWRAGPDAGVSGRCAWDDHPAGSSDGAPRHSLSPIDTECCLEPRRGPRPL
jgi:uncharacterized hydrophobic protein (TIGR00271 family)